jgi:hypothetical protein
VTTRYFTDLREFKIVDAAASIGYQTTLRRTVKVAMNQGFSYQRSTSWISWRRWSLCPRLTASRHFTLARLARCRAHPLDSYQYNGGASISKSVGRHSTIASDFSYRSTKFANSAQPFFWRQLGVHYSHNLDEHLALRLGYAYGLQQDSIRVDLPETVNQNLDLGVDYGRAISRSRRTHLAFSSGSSIVNYLGKQYFVVTGNAVVRRELGRTWNASLTYNRGVQFVEGLTGPLRADSFQTLLSGLLSHRFDVSAFAGYSRGQLGLGSTDPGYDTLQAGTSLRYAFARTLSFQAEYQYYMYDFSQGARLPPGVAPTTNRNSVRIGLTGWLPLVGR